MATRTSQLIVELLDRVSAPARRVSDALRGIGRAVSTPGAMTERLNGAIARNEAALDRARTGALDAVGAYYALSSAIGAPVRAAMEFESAMADVKKVVDFGGADEIKAFEKDLMAMTKRVPMAVTGLAEIAAAAGQAGVAKEDILAFTEAAAQIGVAFDISAGEAGEAMAKLGTGLGLTLAETKLLTDAMNHLSNKQASSAAEILDVVRRVGAQGKQYGYTAEEVAAFGSAMVSSGAQTDVAATSFMNMGRALTRGASATKRQREAYKALGMDAEKVAVAMQKDAVKTTVTVMEAIAALPKEVQAAISSDLFGDEARALGPLLTNLDLVRESLGLVADEAVYAGSATKEFEVRAKTFQNRAQLFNNAMSRLKVTLGNALLPILTDLMDRLEPIIDKIAEWISLNPDLVGQIISAVAALVAFKGALAAIRFVGLLGAGGALNLLAVGMATVGRAGAHLWGAARASVALQTALGAMSGGQTLGVISKLGIGLRGAIWAVPGVSLLASAIAGIGAAVATISAPVWAAFAIAAAAIAAVGVTIWKNWDRITATLSGVAQAIGEILAPALDAIRPVLDWFAPLGDVIASGWRSAVSAIQEVGKWLGTVFQQETLSEDDKAKAKQAGYDFIMSLWNGMKQVMTDLLQWVKDKAAELLAPFSGLGDAIRSYLPGSSVTAADNPAGEFAGVDGARARGGPISRGGTYLTGENGPELITASRSGYVHNARETAEMLGGNPAAPSAARPSQVTNTVNLGGVVVNAAPGQDAEQIARAVLRRVEENIGAALRGVQADTGVEAY